MTKILVIEDEESVRENLLELLEAEDFEVVAAANGRIGVELAHSMVPDLILCDMMMPELDGFGVLNTLRQDYVTATIPFIFLTAKFTKADFRQGMDLGADDYVTKPFTRAELLSAIISRLEKQSTLTKHLATKPLIKTFTPGMQLIEISLRRALELGELQQFQIYYQPIINITSGKIIAAESFLRWESPELGMVSSAELIPLAESTGLMIPIGEWVLEQVLQQLKKWRDRGFSSFPIAINFSPLQFLKTDFISKTVDFLSINNFQNSDLQIQLTESMLIQDINNAIATMKELKSLGFNIAIDDFGTGYSSLMYLNRLPINTLKLDRYFIHNIASDSQKSAITTALIQMFHNLNLNVVAKGVETKEELEFLRHNNCDAMQGFIFSNPLTATEFDNILLINEHLLVEKIT
jgi:EAL domain-containing protein (putative c-di-GMP-specific phosphodiesterase class I)/ActR/RegA family two-component response regulator